jgi:hypothetical protein
MQKQSFQKLIIMEKKSFTTYILITTKKGLISWKNIEKNIILFDKFGLTIGTRTSYLKLQP